MSSAYLDNNATTRLAPEALAAMMPYLTDAYWNASTAIGQVWGVDAALTGARRALGRLCGSADLAPSFHLTSGASEANSWALGAVRPGEHLVVSAIEHPSLLAAARAAERRGVRVSTVAPDGDGRITPEVVAAALGPATRLVSIMLANNETGVLQPLPEIGVQVRRIAPEALVHTDATQAAGRVALDLQSGLSAVDLLSLSAHKFHGPKGVGALFVREGVVLEPIIHGGENGSRGGTADTAAAAGLAVAAERALAAVAGSGAVLALKADLERKLRRRWPGARVNGARVARLPNTVSVTLPGVDAQHLVDRLALEGVAVSTGAACRSGAVAPSHVLTAMGMSADEARSTLRFSLSAYTTPDELAYALDVLERETLHHGGVAA